MSADLASQKAIRAALVASEAVTAVVPAQNILDRNSTPAPRPGIVIGEAQTVDGGGIARQRQRIYHTLHFWIAEPGRTGTKWAMEAARKAIMSGALDMSPDWHCVDRRIENTRVFSDPDGETSHGVMVVNVLADKVQP